MNKYDSVPTLAASKSTTPLDQIAETLRLARDVADRTQYLIGRLCGHIPQPGQDAVNGEKPSNGVLHDLAENAITTRQRLHATLDELSRLETTIS